MYFARDKIWVIDDNLPLRVLKIIISWSSSQTIRRGLKAMVWQVKVKPSSSFYVLYLYRFWILYVCFLFELWVSLAIDGHSTLISLEHQWKTLQILICIYQTYLAVSDIRLFVLFIKYILSAKYSVFDEYSTWNFRFIIYSSKFIC